MSLRTSHVRSGFLGVVAGLALCGCSFALDLSAATENRCKEDLDCPGAICDVEASRCVSPTTEVTRIGLEVLPAGDPSGAMQTRFVFVDPIELTGPEHRDLLIPAPIGVFGNVRAPSIEGPVTAEVRFVRRNTFPGGPHALAETITVGDPVEAADGLPADYALRVVADEDYDVLVKPTGEALRLLPPLRTALSVPGGGDFVRMDLTFPEGMSELVGVVVDDDGDPVDGLLVRAEDRVTRELVSSVVVTGGAADSAPGEFRLAIDPTVESWSLRITGGADRPLFPTLTADPDYFYPDEIGHVRILVPTLVPVRYVGTVEPELSAGTGGLEGASVTLRSVDVFDDATNVSGAFEASATTDARGRFTVDVFPGTYDVIIAPPTGMELPTPGAPQAPVAQLGILLVEGVRIERPETGDTIMGQLFQLPERARLGGEVRTPDDRVMPGANVHAEPLAWIAGMGVTNAAARYNRSSDAVTDATGQFALRLDVGSYDVEIRPPAGSGFPWIVNPDRTFASSARVSEILELSAPVPVTGAVLLGHDGVPLSGAEVRAYAIIENDGQVRAVGIGRATTQPDGSYTLLLPARF